MVPHYGLPYKLISEIGTNFVSDALRTFCKELNIDHAVSSSNKYHRVGQAETYIKFIKKTMKMCIATKKVSIYLSYIQD